MSLSRSVLVKVLADTKQFRGEIKKAGATVDKELTRGQKAMGKLGKAAKIGTLAVAGGLAASVVQFAKFDDALNGSIAIMGDVSQEMRGELSDAAREVGLTTRFSAEQAAESLFFLASAGLDATASMKAMPIVARFAQAGMFDMALATDLLTDAQSSLGLTTDDAAQNILNMTRVSDVFVKANTLANTSVQQVSEAITNKLGGALRSYNIEIEEGVAVLAAYADQGLKGAAAGEAMNIMLRDLKKVAGASKDVLAENNIAILDNEGNFRNMADVVEDLTNAFGHLSVAEQTQLAADLGFQDRSFKNIQLLFGQADAIRKYEEGLDSAAGVTEEISDNQLESFAAQLDLAKGKVIDLAIGLGSELAPAVLGSIDALGGIAEALAPLAETAAKATGGFLDLVNRGLLSLNSMEFLDLPGASEADLAMTQAAKSALRYMESVDKVNEAVERGTSVQLAFSNGLAHMASSGTLTADSIKGLAKVADLSKEEIVAATSQNLEWAKSSGVAGTQVAVLRIALREQIMALGLSTEETNNLIEAYGVMAPASDRGHDAAKRLRDAANGVTGALDGAGDSADDYSDDLVTLQDELLAAEAAQTSLSDVLKAAADPVFKAVSAFSSYSDVLEKIDEDGERSAAEQLELAESILNTQSALDGLSGDALESALDSIAIALDTDRQAVVDLLNELGILDGMTVEALIELGLTGAGAGALGGGSINTFSGGGGGPRKHGGPVHPGEEFLVGERGPEMFVPTTPGSIVAGAVTNTRTQNITFNNSQLADDPVKAIRSRFAFDSMAGSF